MKIFNIILFSLIFSSCSTTKTYKYVGFEKILLCKKNNSYSPCKGTPLLDKDPTKIILSDDVWKNIKQFHIIDLQTDHLYCSTRGKKATIKTLKESNEVQIGNKIYKNLKSSSLENGYKFLVEKINGNYSKHESYTLICAEPLREEVLREI